MEIETKNRRDFIPPAKKPCHSPITDIDEALQNKTSSGDRGQDRLDVEGLAREEDRLRVGEEGKLKVEEEEVRKIIDQP